MRQPSIAADHIKWEAIGNELEAVDDESDSEACVDRWARLYKTAKRIRRLQRLWAYIAQYLQTIDPRLRSRLTDQWPARSQ